MNTDPRIAHEARVLRLRLETGLASLRDVEVWAEGLLVSTAEPPHELIELAMSNARRREATESTLRDLGGEFADADDVVAALASARIDELKWDQLKALALWCKSWSHMVEWKQLGSDPARILLCGMLDCDDLPGIDNLTGVDQRHMAERVQQLLKDAKLVASRQETSGGVSA